MPLSTAKLCLSSNSLRFREPSVWDDPFERLYYTADYSNLNSNSRFSTKLFACCLTNKPNSEAAWRIYTKEYEEDPCVQFKIYIGQFRQAIERFIKESKASIYEGKVMYDLSEYQLLHLYQKSNKLYPIFFDEFELDKYLNLMLLKRPHFAYENEIRFFIHNYTSKENFMDVKIPWSHCLDSITLPPIVEGNRAVKFREEIEEALRKNYELCRTKCKYLYHSVIHSRPNTLYQPIDHIVIEA